MRIDPCGKFYWLYPYQHQDARDQLQAGDEFWESPTVGWCVLHAHEEAKGSDFHIRNHPKVNCKYRRRIDEFQPCAPRLPRVDPALTGWIPAKEFNESGRWRKPYFVALNTGEVTVAVACKSAGHYCKPISLPPPPRTEEEFAFEAELEKFSNECNHPLAKDFVGQTKSDYRRFWTAALEFAKKHL